MGSEVNSSGSSLHHNDSALMFDMSALKWKKYGNKSIHTAWICLEAANGHRTYPI